MGVVVDMEEVVVEVEESESVEVDGIVPTVTVTSSFSKVESSMLFKPLKQLENMQSPSMSTLTYLIL